MGRLNRHFALGVLSALLLLPAPSRANPVDAFGLGARTISLGGAGTAAADDFSANYYNPAALAADDRLRIEVGYTFVSPTLRINDKDLGVDAHRGFQAGLVLPGAILGKRVAFSMGIFLPDRLLTRVRALPDEQPRFVLYDNRPQRLVLSASLAFEIIDGLTVGAGLTFMTHTRGMLDVQGRVGFTDVEETELFTALQEDLTAVRYPTIGLLYRPTPAWRIGVTYREEFQLKLDLGVRVSGDIVEEGVVTIENGSFDLVSATHNLFSPRQLAVGGAYEAGDWFFTFDLTWAQWSEFPTPTADVALTFDIPGLPLDIPPPPPPSPTDFHDIFIPRAGVEWHAFDIDLLALALRGGYFYEPTPVPPQRGVTNFVDSDKHGFSLGVGIEFRVLEEIFSHPLGLDLTGQIIYLPPRLTTKTNPADAVGGYRADGLWVGVCLMTHFLF